MAMARSVRIWAIGLACFELAYSQTIADAVSSFKDELDVLFCDGLKVGGDKCSGNAYGVQNFLDSFTNDFDSGTEDASTTVTQIIARLDAALRIRASFLTNMSAALSSSCVLYDAGDMTQVESIGDFASLKFAGNADRSANLHSDMAYSDVYGKICSLSSTTYDLPNDVDYREAHIQQDAKISMLLEETMLSLRDNYCINDNGEEEYCAMYFGSINGLFRQFPGAENFASGGVYESYDPRFRPWYVRAASGSKDVVILIDTSGSMQSSNRMALAIDAVLAVLQTLGSATFVSVVAFDSDVTLSCFGMFSFIHSLFDSKNTIVLIPFQATNWCPRPLATSPNW